MELGSLVEFLELPLPDKQRLRQIIDETTVRVGKSTNFEAELWTRRALDSMADNLRGLTEEEAERATYQAIVTRYGLTAETVTDVLDAKKELLRHSGMLEFIDTSENLSGVGGLENLKRWLAQRRGTWGEAATRLRFGSAKRRDHPGRAGMRQEHVRPRHCRRVEAAAGQVRHGGDF